MQSVKMRSYGFERAFYPYKKRRDSETQREEWQVRMKTEIGVAQWQARAAHCHQKLGVSLGQILPQSPQKGPVLLPPGFQTSEL